MKIFLKLIVLLTAVISANGQNSEPNPMKFFWDNNYTAERVFSPDLFHQNHILTGFQWARSQSYHTQNQSFDSMNKGLISGAVKYF